MAFSGPWDLDGKGLVYDFNERTSTLTISPQQDDIDEDNSSSSQPPTAAFTYKVKELEQLLTLTPSPPADATAIVVYQITSRTDTKIALRRLQPAASDSMEEEVLVLIPSGLPDDLRDGDLDGDDDGNDSGVDMGMDLCVVGKKI
jgi:hypothetical protein